MENVIYLEEILVRIKELMVGITKEMLLDNHNISKTYRQLPYYVALPNNSQAVPTLNVSGGAWLRINLKSKKHCLISASVAVVVT